MYVMFLHFIKGIFQVIQKAFKKDVIDPIDELHLKRSEGLKSCWFCAMTLLPTAALEELKT